jgi:hypothetical protein
MSVNIDLKNMDWGLLRRQKRHLVTMANDYSKNALKCLKPEEAKVLDGIISLIDAIQDNAVESGQLTEQEVFKAKMPRRVK